MSEDRQDHTLITCASGAPQQIVGFTGGAAFEQRLRNLGLTEGRTVVKVHSHPFRGPVTVRVQNSVIAIGHGMAKRVQVQAVQQ